MTPRRSLDEGYITKNFNLPESGFPAQLPITSSTIMIGGLHPHPGGITWLVFVDETLIRTYGLGALIKFPRDASHS